jgi:FkbM family methyltransferase
MIPKIIQKIYRTITGKNIDIKCSIVRNKVWLGSDYGGFFVCLDTLGDNAIIYSFGIGEDISFDREIMNNCQCTVYGFDPTPKSIEWISAQNCPPNFKFFPFGIATKSGEVEFYLPQRSEYVSGSILQNQNVDVNRKIKVPMKSFDDIVKVFHHSKIDVLKMDIEGAEYEVLPEILKSSVQIDQILLEFHHRMMPNGKALTMQAIQLLKNYGYEIFGISDTHEEVSFMKTS